MAHPEGLSQWTATVAKELTPLSPAQARVLALWSYGMVLTQSCACHTIAVFLGLVLTVLLGAWAATTAATTGRLRWLLACAALVGLGFNIKMLEAYLVIPAFGLVYLWSAPGRLRRRIGHLALATVALLTASLSWAVAVDLTPASLRPYVGSSGTNSELNLALGYNGLSRLLGGSGTPGGIWMSSVSSASDSSTPSASRWPTTNRCGCAVPRVTEGGVPVA